MVKACSPRAAGGVQSDDHRHHHDHVGFGQTRHRRNGGNVRASAIEAPTTLRLDQIKPASTAPVRNTAKLESETNFYHF